MSLCRAPVAEAAVNRVSRPRSDLETSIMKAILTATSATALLVAACGRGTEPPGEPEQTTRRTPRLKSTPGDR